MNYLIKNIHIPISLMAFDLWISWLLTRTGLFCRDKGYKFFENKIEGYVKFLYSPTPVSIATSGFSDVYTRYKNPPGSAFIFVVAVGKSPNKSF